MNLQDSINKLLAECQEGKEKCSHGEWIKTEFHPKVCKSCGLVDGDFADYYDGYIAKQEELRGALARGYCTDRNSHKVLDPDLIEDMAKEVAEI